jgi:hypothetical protein
MQEKKRWGIWLNIPQLRDLFDDDEYAERTLRINIIKENAVGHVIRCFSDTYITDCSVGCVDED